MKNIKHVWTVLCKKSVVDRETNNITLFDVLERLDVGVEIKNQKLSGLPEKVVLPFSFEIVTMWARSDFEDKIERKVEAKTEILDPNGVKIGNVTNNFVMSPEFRRMRSIGRLSNIGLTISGKYFFKISGKESDDKDFKNVAEIPLEVIITKKIPSNSNLN